MVLSGSVNTLSPKGRLIYEAVGAVLRSKLVLWSDSDKLYDNEIKENTVNEANCLGKV